MKDYPRHYIVNLGGHPTQLFRYGSGIIERTADLTTTERYVPRILVALGVTESTGEVRRNRKELVEDVGESPQFQRINYGKRVIDIFAFNTKEAHDD